MTSLFQIILANDGESLVEWGIGLKEEGPSVKNGWVNLSGKAQISTTNFLQKILFF